MFPIVAIYGAYSIKSIIKFSLSPFQIAFLSSEMVNSHYEPNVRTPTLQDGGPKFHHNSQLHLKTLYLETIKLNFLQKFTVYTTDGVAWKFVTLIFGSFLNLHVEKEHSSSHKRHCSSAVSQREIFNC